MYPHDWFFNLLTAYQWVAVVILAGIFLGILFSILFHKDGILEAFGLGLVTPLFVLGFIGCILHFTSFIVWLWNN